MPYKDFYNNEIGFQEWQDTHPEGVFVNSLPGKLSPRYMVAHKADCQTVARHKGRATVYSKHCFKNLDEAQKHLTEKYNKEASTGCTTCKIGKDKK